MLVLCPLSSDCSETSLHKAYNVLYITGTSVKSSSSAAMYYVYDL